MFLGFTPNLEAGFESLLDKAVAVGMVTFSNIELLRDTQSLMDTVPASTLYSPRRSLDPVSISRSASHNCPSENRPL